MLVEAGGVRVTGNPIKISGYEDPPTRTAAPTLDQHGDALRREYAEVQAAARGSDVAAVSAAMSKVEAKVKPEARRADHAPAWEKVRGLSKNGVPDPAITNRD